MSWYEGCKKDPAQNFLRGICGKQFQSHLAVGRVPMNNVVYLWYREANPAIKQKLGNPYAVNAPLRNTVICDREGKYSYGQETVSTTQTFANHTDNWEGFATQKNYFFLQNYRYHAFPPPVS
ncbi:MAG: hypothetical protein RMJ87_07185 [Cytophagales bacterium]|nr:hypothetical protein [Bernardetiaceae bacterium]MDW8204795.1 hypothetical protein [Cytophagales bacterium]